ncbi:hypothetical protein [Streptomyces virginiae]
MDAEHEASGPRRRDRWKRVRTRSHLAVRAATPYVELLAAVTTLVVTLR